MTRCRIAPVILLLLVILLATERNSNDGERASKLWLGEGGIGVTKGQALVDVKGKGKRGEIIRAK